MDSSMRRFAHVHLGLAVDTERGLMVPTLFGADTLSLSALSVAAKTAAKECQTGSINPDKLKGGTFTVTNLGTFGIESFTPVLNAPQTGILGVNTLETKVRKGPAGIETYEAMGLSLTFDHRALDGAPAARFLKDLTGRLERFGALLAL
jgi:pyruvate dehydrogenase E2 component (dihydrolipoamide acetyltransferase)